MTKTRCPLCVDNAMSVWPKEDPNYDIKYDMVSLKNHLRTHKEDEFITFIVFEAEDPDNNYRD